MEQELRIFIDSLEAMVKPLETEASKSYFTASVTGAEEEYAKYGELNIKLSKIFADKDAFAKIKAFKDSGKIQDPLLKRQLDILYSGFLARQIDEKKLEELINAETKLEQRYATFRAQVEGEKFTDNEIENVLKNSTDNRELETCWLASKQIGDSVAGEVKRLVKMRNEIAHELGFKNYHDMSLRLDEQDPDEIEKIFDELDELTKDVFKSLKAEMDNFLSARYTISPDELMPWHYQNRFFQEAPVIYNINLDSYYEGQDVVRVTDNFYGGIGIDVQKIIDNSDLYEKEGKYQHAYCMHVDRSGDVRVLCNVKNNDYWMSTMLHEFGHGVYDQNIDMSLPYFLRSPAHTFTTEAIAMLFGRLTSNPEWLKDNLHVPEEEADRISEDLKNNIRLQQLVQSRWFQVMFRFEKSMYANPDQDLNKLWWDLVEQYQMIKMPAGRDNADWAAKIHVALYPCYYHNYQLGELLASQLQAYINTQVLGVSETDLVSLSHNEDVGHYLLENVFKPGAKYEWNDMIEQATGEGLTAIYFANQFVN